MLRRLLLAAIVASPALLAAGSHLPLGGTWEFQLDPQKTGHAERWFERQLGPDTIFLPGSTDQGGYGTKVVKPEMGHLTRPYQYEGLGVVPEGGRDPGDLARRSTSHCTWSAPTGPPKSGWTAKASALRTA